LGPRCQPDWVNLLEEVPAFLVSFVLAFVPVWYRRRWLEGENATELGAAAVASGLVEFIAAVVVFMLRYWAAASGRRILTALIDPRNLILFAFVAEGMIRFLAGVAGQSPPLLVLQLVAWFHGGIGRERERRAMGPFVPDEVTLTGDGELRVSSCRPKPHWDRYVSVRYGGEFYALIGQDRVPGPRPFRYTLRKRGEDETIAVVYLYDPEIAEDSGAAPVRWTPAG
jgi:hypothetical protein